MTYCHVSNEAKGHINSQVYCLNYQNYNDVEYGIDSQRLALQCTALVLLAWVMVYSLFLHLVLHVEWH